MFLLVNTFLQGLGRRDPVDGVTSEEASSKLPGKMGAVFIFSAIFLGE